MFHHLDGIIIIQSEGKMYSDTVENFRIDLGEDYPGLPGCYIGRYYMPGQSHYFTTGDTAYPQQREWPEGDRYIADIERLLAAKKRREKGIKES